MQQESSPCNDHQGNISYFQVCFEFNRALQISKKQF